MKFLGILRVSALCLLAIGFRGQPVSCGLFNKILSSKKSSSDKVSENSEGDLAEQASMLQAKLQALEAWLDKAPEESSTDNMAESTMESPLVEEAEESTVKSQAVENSSQEPSSESSAPLPKSGLVFESSEWDDSQLANAFLFIKEFCSLVNAEKFGGNLKAFNGAKGLSVKVKSLCSNFSSRLGSLSANLVPSGVTVNPYEKALKSEKFNTCVEWLVKNIPGIRESVQKMFNESKKLNKAQLKDTTSMGPSKYGFEFVGDKWKPFVHYKLKDLTWCLRATLKYLQKYLDKVLKESPVNAGDGSEGDLAAQVSMIQEKLQVLEAEHKLDEGAF
ncbi:secreted antigen 1 [Babesia divergens]|uniref:Secreted antigen 1 n=1 Tax=Babesia divergens TaxID=32595 RepID=A0AAD9GF99_BABDI|nr:secreted antigen 1 [Babesia divergens]